MEEVPKVKNFELPEAVKNIELLPAIVKNMELPEVVKNLELPEVVKNIELPEAMKNLDISNAVRNVPTTVMNNVPESVKNIQVPKSMNAAMFSSFATTALTSVASLTKTIQQKVEETAKNLQHEHEVFVKQVNEEAHKPKTGTEAVAPWVGLPNEDSLKQQMLALSHDKRNFTIPPPENTNFQFDMNIFFQTAMAALNADPNLNYRRFELVPAHVQEPTFWRNYFYRISLIKQTSLGSIDSIVLENEVFSKDPNEESRKFEEKQEEKNEEVDSSNKEVLFDANKSGNESDAWIQDFATAAGIVSTDGDEEEPDNWEEQLNQHLSSE
ncbi:8424_t:CDS:2 [Funneliformis caledonium]|uniref:8424_t:CDS:1 n=1 Tax=Funneliformis caledonium TaxID=1117310 RepID=A0A9N9DYS6_9GLOM|nr:8424_t:CDS:2 [Funneliformis caledonium]